MSIPDYDGHTFVAFADISGFTEMMNHNNHAIKALNSFYNAGYDVLQNETCVHGILISDSAVLFVKNSPSPLETLLKVVENLNRAVLKYDIMLTTSIAYGHFSYHQRLEFQGIEKNQVYGNAYVNAYIDNEKGQPRIQPGQCRIVKKGLECSSPLTLPRLKRDKEHYYFYWMVEDDESIDSFNSSYSDAYQQKYRGMLEAIKKADNNRL